MASTNIVLGENVTVFKYDDLIDVWVPYACARSCTFTLETDIIETSITGAGKFRTFLPVSNSFTGTLEGLTQLDTANNLSIADLMALQLSHTILLMRFEDVSNVGKVFTKEARFFITNTSETASFDNVATFSVNLQGTGQLTLIYTPTKIIQGIMYREEFILPNGQASVTIPALDGIHLTDVISIVLDNGDISVIIGTGTPLGQEVKFSSAGATITFPFAPDMDLNGYISYQKIYETP